MGLSDSQFIHMNIKNHAAFIGTLQKAAKQVDDLRFPMGEISRDFYKSEKAIFQLSSPGGYPDLAESTKKQKKRLGIPLYPILKRSGRLEASITGPGAEGSINIIGRKSLIIGTAISYGIFHNSDEPRSKIPQRKFVFIGPESREFAGRQEFGGRLVRWNNIITKYVEAVLKESGAA